jgi:O-antigen ligase
MGGSTRSIWPNLLLQLGAIAILAWSVQQPLRIRPSASSRHLAALVIAMLAVLALELVPLPPQIWTLLPGRQIVANGFDLLGQPRPWLPLSLTPYDTMASALWLLPPLAMLAGILRLGAYREQWLAVALGLATLGGIVLGILQVTSAGLEPWWYPYATTNNGLPVGTFANSNHMGTLLIATFPFIAALVAARSRVARQKAKNLGKILLLVQGALVLALSLSISGSVAALGLAVPVAGATLLLRSSLRERWAQWSLVAVAVAGVAVTVAIFSSPFANYRPEVKANHADYSRYASFSNSLRAAADTFPFGSGTGSFPSVYPAYEKADLVDSQFINHVHNDYIELALETGLAGVVLMMAFLLWWTRRAIAIWSAPTIDYFARASTIASGAILAHSVVDYPLRTSAIAALFALCVALMAEPRSWVSRAPAGAAAAGGARHLSLS